MDAVERGDQRFEEYKMRYVGMLWTLWWWLVGWVLCGSSGHAAGGHAAVLPKEQPRSAHIEYVRDATVGVLAHTQQSTDTFGPSQLSIRGTGMHVGAGYVVTARHVVERVTGGQTIAEKQISVLTNGLAELRADLVGVNAFLDIALYRFVDSWESAVPSAVSFSGEDPVSGDEVFTVGYPLGWGPAMAFGRLGNPDTFLPSASSRLLQLDLAVCRGNSGGGLFNRDGDVVGVLQAIIQTNQTQGDHRCSQLAFAVPAAVVRDVVRDLKAGRDTRFPRLGIRMTVVKMGTQWRVAVADAKGPARTSGIRKGDVLLAIDDYVIMSPARLKNYIIERTRPGAVVALRVLRNDKERVIKVILGTSGGK